MHKNIGRNGEDRITGFRGTIVGRVEYLTGCNQLLIVPKVKEDGSYVDSQWFDEQRVEVSGTQIVLDNGATPGPDKAAPKR